MAAETIMGLAVSLGLDSSQLDIGLKRSEKASVDSTGKMGESLGGLAKSLLSPIAGYFTLAGAIAGAGKFMADVISVSSEAERVEASLSQTLLSTGRAAEISFASLDNFATALQRTSSFDDDDILKAYNALTKFSSIPTDQIDAITKAGMDMTAALGGDLATNVESIGAALESNLIPRSWHFSEALKGQIKAQMDAGDTAGALKSMMDELNNRFGGQASANLNTYAGSVLAVRASMENLEESIGKPELLGGIKIFNLALADFLDQQARISGPGVTTRYASMSTEALNKALETNSKNLDAATGHYDTAMLAQQKFAIQTEIANRAQKLQGIILDDNLPKLTIVDNTIDVLSTTTNAYADDVYAMIAYQNAFNDSMASGQSSAIAWAAGIKAASAEISAEYGFVSSAAKTYSDYDKKIADEQASLGNLITTNWGQNTQEILDAKAAISGFVGEQQKAMGQAMINQIDKTWEASPQGMTPQRMQTLLDMQVQMGLTSQAAADSAMKYWDMANAIAAIPDDKQAQFRVLMGIDGIDQAIQQMTTLANIAKSAAIYAYDAENGIYPTDNPYPEGSAQWEKWNHTHKVPGFAYGGSFSVPPGYPSDSYLMGVSSGEHVTVTPAGNGSAGTENTFEISIVIQGNADANLVGSAAQNGLLEAMRAKGKA